VAEFFVQGFKAPGWQISDPCYQVLLERGWWVADQHLEDQRRPPGLRTYFYEDGNWHGHIQDVCGNGIEETWHELRDYVAGAASFEFASEALD
jgi:predicted deacetylase